MSLNVITARETPPPGQATRPSGLGFVGKLRWGAKHPPLDFDLSFAGKTVLVTGCNTGLGFEAAVKYSALGADKLILGVRTAAKGEATKSRILSRTGRGPESITYLVVDLATFTSVRAFCASLAKEVEHSGLDIALLSAGLAPPRYEMSSEGWDMALQVNVLSTALMARLLVPLLKPTSHLTFVNSNGNDLVERKWFDKYEGSMLRMANDPDGWDAMRSYCTVKLLGLVVMRAIADVAGPDVVVNAVCPGMCKTDLGRDQPWLSRQVMGLAGKFVMRSAEEGGRSLVSATALGVESRGKLWHNDVLYP
ncbi:dehydrogenase [Echria macrotheca]|uniref:Dehydrogenase n=1 Tax=Echria macrotheca TaxID=438768 RepID=A0AAJ0B740_9PEZI|nr:dehydrogenase [Echria macrotheca]